MADLCSDLLRGNKETRPVQPRVEIKKTQHKVKKPDLCSDTEIKDQHRKNTTVCNCILPKTGGWAKPVVRGVRVGVGGVIGGGVASRRGRVLNNIWYPGY